MLHLFTGQTVEGKIQIYEGYEVHNSLGYWAYNKKMCNLLAIPAANRE